MSFIRRRRTGRMKSLRRSSSERYLISSNGQVWTQDRSGSAGRQPLANVFSGYQGFARDLHPDSRQEAFEVFFKDLIDCAVRFTNLYGRRLTQEKDLEWRTVTADEICAFIGLHFLAGALKAHHRKLGEFWSEHDGHPLFIGTMSCLRLKQLKQTLRFDDLYAGTPTTLSVQIAQLWTQ